MASIFSKFSTWFKSLPIWGKALVILVAIGLIIPRGNKSESTKNTTQTASAPEPEPVKTREDTLKSYFSGWDGSHRGLVKSVEATMNDPDSFDHVDTRYWDQGKKIRVKMRFRGKNAFNAVITASCWADLDPATGEILEWAMDE